MTEEVDNLELKEVLFYSMVDEFLIYRYSKKFLLTLFDTPLGQWNNVNEIFTNNNFVFDSEELEVSVCWLNDIDVSNVPYRTIIFFELKYMFSQVVVFNTNTLDE